MCGERHGREGARLERHSEPLHPPLFFPLSFFSYLGQLQPHPAGGQQAQGLDGQAELAGAAQGGDGEAEEAEVKERGAGEGQGWEGGETHARPLAECVPSLSLSAARPALSVGVGCGPAPRPGTSPSPHTHRETMTYRAPRMRSQRRRAASIFSSSSMARRKKKQKEKDLRRATPLRQRKNLVWVAVCVGDSLRAGGAP